MLVLFDIDGTLLEAPSEIHARALAASCQAVHGVEVQVPAIGADAFNGMTSPMLARVVLREAGVEDTAIDAKAGQWRRSMALHYLRLQQHMAEQRPFADAQRVVSGLADSGVRIGLLTGNLREVAVAKLRRAGVWDRRLDLAQGAFGEDSDERDDLGRIARRRMPSSHPEEGLIIVGDTPRDITCARAAGAKAVALTTGDFTAEALADADLVADSLTAMVAHIFSAAGARPSRGATGVQPIRP